jgi:Undecaprenyl-phosphate glucose phosphotransferase
MNAAVKICDSATPLETANPANRRGPFRPDALVSPRLRIDGAVSLRRMRALDMTLLVVSGMISFSDLVLSNWNKTPLGNVAPTLLPILALIVMPGIIGFYRVERRENPLLHLARLFIILFTGFFAARAALVWSPDAARVSTALTRWALMSGALLTGLHLLWIGLMRYWRAKGRLTPNVIIVGATRHARTLIETALQRRDVNILGVFDDRLSRNPDAVCGVPVLGNLQDLTGHKIMPYIDQIVIAIDTSARARVQDIVGKLSGLPNKVSLLVDIDSDSRRNAALSRLSNLPMARVSGVATDEDKALVKRIQDLAIASLALIVFAPVMALVALAIRLDSPGPIFFRQRRHGFNNEAIHVWKFRSMRTETADPTAAQQVTRGDPRVTRVGRFIRKTSLDELPQLFNVLAGDMSLVGPRPHAIGMKTGDDDSARLVTEYAWRHRVKPGMTGWAQIKGSRGAMHTPEDVQRRIALDIAYIERHSFWLDLYIMLMTVPCLLGDAKTVR